MTLFSLCLLFSLSPFPFICVALQSSSCVVSIVARSSTFRMGTSFTLLRPLGRLATCLSDVSAGFMVKSCLLWHCFSNILVDMMSHIFILVIILMLISVMENLELHKLHCSKQRAYGWSLGLGNLTRSWMKCCGTGARYFFLCLRWRS